jgi:hypothetical protein
MNLFLVSSNYQHGFGCLLVYGIYTNAYIMYCICISLVPPKSSQHTEYSLCYLNGKSTVKWVWLIEISVMECTSKCQLLAIL